MGTYVALLRGINVSGHNQIKMPVLRAMFEALGHSAVATYIQSGNVVFTSRFDQDSDLADAIEARISADLGMEVAVILRSAAQLADVVTANPFPAPGADPARVYVTFLADAPDPAAVDGFEDNGAGDDEFVVRGREVYLRCPGGYGRTRLNNGLWERRLRTPATTRNWKTVTTLADMAGPAASPLS